MDSINGFGGMAALSLMLNIVVVILQAKQSAAVAELKVYMHENFTPKKQGIIENAR
jgi:hypothetical protein